MNFYKESDQVQPANKSGRWCPVENMTSFDIARGDKIVFLRFKGSSCQDVNKIWTAKREIYHKLFLDEIWVGKVTLPILSREEYCALKKYPISKPLWYDETVNGKLDPRVRARKDRGEKFRWNRVFEFEKIAVLSSMNLYLRNFARVNTDFANVAREVYTSQKSREISLELYDSTMEQIACHLNDDRQAREYPRVGSLFEREEYIPTIH